MRVCESVCVRERERGREGREGERERGKEGGREREREREGEWEREREGGREGACAYVCTFTPSVRNTQLFNKADARERRKVGAVERVGTLSTVQKVDNLSTATRQNREGRRGRTAPRSGSRRCASCVMKDTELVPYLSSRAKGEGVRPTAPRSGSRRCALKARTGTMGAGGWGLTSPTPSYIYILFPYNIILVST